MANVISAFKRAHPQTKFLIFNLVLYMSALIWTTAQAYARLEYCRTDTIRPPIVIQDDTPDDSK